MDGNPRELLRDIRSFPLMYALIYALLASKNSQRINNEDRFEIEHSFALENNFIG